MLSTTQTAPRFGGLSLSTYGRGGGESITLYPEGYKKASDGYGPETDEVLINGTVLGTNEKVRELSKRLAQEEQLSAEEVKGTLLGILEAELDTTEGIDTSTADRETPLASKHLEVERTDVIGFYEQVKKYWLALIQNGDFKQAEPPYGPRLVVAGFHKPKPQ